MAPFIVPQALGRSPTSALDDLNDSLGHIKLQFPSTYIILGGDFNCPGIDWHTETLTDSYISTLLRETLIEIVDDYQLQQVVTFPTRGNNLLDLCFTSHPDLVQSCLPSPGLCDHDIVLVKFLFQLPPVQQCPRTFHLYKIANWDAIRQGLVSISDEYFLRNQNTTRDVEDNWRFFKTMY